MSEDLLREIIRQLAKISNSLDVFLNSRSEQPEQQVSTKKVMTVEESNNIVIEYEGRRYSRFKPCKYKCGMWSSWADDYKKGDTILHINPMTKEVIGFKCPKYEDD